MRVILTIRSCILLLVLYVFLVPAWSEAALTLTKRESQEAEATTVTSASFTPSDSSLLVVSVTALDFEDSLVDADVVVTGGSLQWTQRVSESHTNGTYVTEIWTAPITSGASMTVQATSNGEAQEMIIHVVDLTGYDVVAPIGATGSGEGTAVGPPAQFSFNLDSTTALTSVVVAAVAVDTTAAFAAGTGWTEQYQTLTSNIEPLQTQTRTASSSVKVYWNTVDTAFEVTGVAIEVKAAATASTLSKPPNNLGLVGYWSFNEGTGTIAGDFSGNGSTGTLNGDTSWMNGKRGKALNFDGSNDYVQMNDPTVLRLSGSRTISAWFNLGSVPAGGGTCYPIAGRGNSGGSVALNYSLIVDNGCYGCPANPAFLDLFDSTGNQGRNCYGITPVAGTWYHLVGVYDSQNNLQTLYLNGVSVATNDTTGVSPNSTTGNFVVGSHPPDLSDDFHGKIDEVRVYNRALGPTEVTALAKSGAVKFTSSSVELQRGSTLADGLVGHWTFDGPDVTTTVSDRSGQSNNGYFYNNATSSAKTIGVLGQGLAFDGTDDYVQVPHTASLIPTAAISMGAWFKITNNTLIDKIIGKSQSGGYSIGFNEGVTGNCSGNGFFHPRFRINGTYDCAEYASSNFANNTWYHVVATYDSETILLYVNGELVVTNSAPSGVIQHSGTNPLCIGQESAASDCTSDGSEYFGGKLDDIRIYNRALTASEVKQLYNLGKVKISN